MMHKIAVYSPNGAVPKPDYSHRSAWPKMVLDSLRVSNFELQPKGPLSDFDEVWLYLGMEFNGSLNLFGGASDDNADKLLKLLEAPKISYLKANNQFPNCPKLGTLAKERAAKSSSQRWLDLPFATLDNVCDIANVVEQGSHRNAVVGDSHALCLYDGNSNIYRHDHKTMHGAVEDGLSAFYPSYDYLFDKVTFCFGNIDLQHHLCNRLLSDVDELVDSYVYQVAAQPFNKMEIVELLPVFPEDRKLATTGYYKGKPWNGTWSERNTLRNYINQRLQDQIEKYKDLVSLVRWPSHIYAQDGSFSAEAMESPRGPHLAWSHRRQTW